MLASKPRVLVACEFSGIVREAFAARGWDAWSCDLLPTEIPGNHYQGDVFDILDDGWNLVIMHPPCTYLSSVANRWLNQPGREELRLDAFGFVMRLIEAPIERWALENPVGYLNTHWRKPDQIIHPYYFGDPFLKRTCLWLHNLPPLEWDKAAAVKPEPMFYSGGDKTKGKPIHWCEGIGSKNSHDRSRTFPGIAAAMADQWSNITTPVQMPLWEALA